MGVRGAGGGKKGNYAPRRWAAESSIVVKGGSEWK